MFFFGVSVQQVQEYLSLPCCHIFLPGRRIPEGIIVFLNQTSAEKVNVLSESRIHVLAFC